MKTAHLSFLIARMAHRVVMSLIFMSVAMALTALAADSASDTTRPSDTTKLVVSDSTRDTLPGPDEFVPMDFIPEMIFEEKPDYPLIAKQKNMSGTVWVKVLVGTDGKVYKALLAKTSGKEPLDGSAMAAALKNRFKPAKKDGKPVACWVTYKVGYKMSEE